MTVAFLTGAILSICTILRGWYSVDLPMFVGLVWWWTWFLCPTMVFLLSARIYFRNRWPIKRIGVIVSGLILNIVAGIIFLAFVAPLAFIPG